MKIPRSFAWIFIIAFLASFLVLPQVSAQDEVDAAGTAVPEIVIPDELVSPRTTFETLYNAIDEINQGRARSFDDALLTLDQSEIPEIIRVSYGREIVLKLAGIMVNSSWPGIEQFSDDPSGASLPISSDEESDTAAIEQVYTTVIFSNEAGVVEITRGIDQAWRVGPGSIRSIVQIYYRMEISGDFLLAELPPPELPEGFPVEFSSPWSCYDYLLTLIAEVEGAGTVETEGEGEESADHANDPRLAMDLSAIAAEEKLTTARDIVRKLAKILDALPSIDREVISNDLTGPFFSVYNQPPLKIEINLGPNGKWILTAGSITAIPDIYIAMINSGEIDILEQVGDEVAGDIPQGLATPRHCYQTYYTAMKRANEGEADALNEAIACLDLSKVPGTVYQEYSVQVVNQLAKILDNIPRIDPEDLSNDSKGPGKVIFSHEAGSIEILKSEDGAWRFSTATVAAIPDIHRELEVAGYFEERLSSGEARFELSGRGTAKDLSMQSLIPSSWKKKTFLIEDWQWLFLLLIVMIGLIIDNLIPLIIGKILRFWFRHSFLADKSGLIPSISRPFGFLAMSGFWWLILGTSGLELNILNVLLTAVKFMTAAGIVWCAYRAVDIVSEFVNKKAGDTESRMDDMLVPFVRRTLKVIVTIFGIIFVASNININVTSLVAGLGIGGLALALAAQDTLANLFGSITVLFDRPFQVGDWVVIGGDIEGTVEELGFRSTRIRTFYNSLITVPNSKLISTHVDNLGERRYRRIKAVLSITYDTPPNTIEAFCEGIRELIRNHPYTRKDYYHVWLNAFNNSSLDVLLYCFVKTPDWATELREKHRLFLDILRIAKELGVEFAFPSQMTYMAKDKEPTPVFPEDEDISTFVSSRRESAGDLARRISHSELGGKGKVPPPVNFRAKAPMDHTDGFDDDGGDG